MFGFSIAASAQAVANQPYVEVTLKSGETVRFEYRPFMEDNLPILPEKKLDSPNQVRWFGARRVIFLEKDSCEKQNIGLENLREMEVIGMDFNPCNQKKGWLVKLILLVRDKYTGFFQTGESNLGKALEDHGVTGQLLGQSKTVTLRYEDIQKIIFFPM
jgi:hypothetical protein